MKVVVCMRSIIRYCSKYVTKPESASIPMKETIKMFAEEHKKEPKDYTAFVSCQKIFNKYLQSRDIGAPELYMILAHKSLVYTDVTLKFVNL